MESFICPNPNCGYKGAPDSRPRGSCLIALILFCFGILPGIIYLVLFSGYDYYCPRCHLKVDSDF